MQPGIITEGKSMESVLCIITGPCPRMCHKPSARTLQHINVSIQNIYLTKNMTSNAIKGKPNDEAHMGNKQAEIKFESLGVVIGLIKVMKSTICSPVRSFRAVEL